MPEPVELAVRWGSQHRLMCPSCKRYIKKATTDGRTGCGICGRVYQRVDGGWREVRDGRS